MFQPNHCHKTPKSRTDKERGMGREERIRKAKAVIVGGSIAGISCAHALIKAGWEVVVLEKSASPPQGSPTGAGLGLDPLSGRLIGSWLGCPELFDQATLPMTIDLNQAIDKNEKAIRTLTRDEKFNFRAAHWADLHGLLYGALPPEIFLWGHLFVSLSISQDKTSVTIKAKALHTGEIAEIQGDLLVAADGSLSSVRQTFLPDLKLRYSGYCAWRGLLDFSGNENTDTISGIRRVFPELGICQYINLTTGSHSVLYELPNKRLNWLWYVNLPEPEIKGTSITTKASIEMVEAMHQEAEKVWPAEYVRVMKETKDPFLNFIYDCEPLDQIFWDNVVLIGDAAHPTTPNGARSTNMSLLDAAVLGRCLQKWGAGNLHSALEEYQSIRLPVTSKQVLHSRRMGRIKQGLSLSDQRPFDPETADKKEYDHIPHKSMPFLYDVPEIID